MTELMTRWSKAVVGTAVLGLLAAGCDAAFDLVHVEPPPPPDAPPPPDGPPPDGLGELGFSKPTAIAALSDRAFDGEPTLPADMTEIYFKSTRAGGLGGFDIWRSRRATVSDAWSAPLRVDELSSSAHETSPRIALDGLTLWLQRSPTGGGPGMTMVSMRQSRTTAWAAPVAVSGLDGAMGDNQFGSSAPDQLVGYLVSERDSTTRPHLFRTTRATSDAAWSTPVEIDELLSTTGFNQNPWTTPDDLAIIFSSDRGGSLGSGDLWLATRATTGDPFGTPINLFEINDEHFQADPWISPDLRHVVFTYTSTGDYEIYEASR